MYLANISNDKSQTYSPTTAGIFLLYLVRLQKLKEKRKKKYFTDTDTIQHVNKTVFSFYVGTKWCVWMGTIQMDNKYSFECFSTHHRVVCITFEILPVCIHMPKPCSSYMWQTRHTRQCAFLNITWHHAIHYNSVILKHLPRLFRSLYKSSVMKSKAPGKSKDMQLSQYQGKKKKKS